MAHPPILRPLTLSLRASCTPSRGSVGSQVSGSIKFVRGKASKASRAAANAKPTPAATSTSNTAKVAESALKARVEKGAPSEVEKEFLPWGDYLAIRKAKRRWETAMTIPLTFAGFATGILIFGEMEMDPTKPIFNLDPMVVYGAATIGCAGFGYLMGPIAGSSCWRLTHRNAMKLIEAKDREFHRHVVKNRVDPTSQSATNPVPDFYGEKIGSLKDYRQWLRDQARYKRKAALPED